MKFASWLIGGILGACHLIQSACAERLLEATSLVPCANDGVIGIDYFNVVFTPDSSSVKLSFDGTIDYSGYVRFDVEVLVYGYGVVNTTIDPCSIETVESLCPLNIKNLDIETATFSMSSSLFSALPSESTRALQRHRWPLGSLSRSIIADASYRYRRYVYLSRYRCSRSRPHGI